MLTAFMRDRSRALLLSLISLAISAIGFLSLASASVADEAAGQIDVVVDQAKLVKLPEHVSTIVVGNPLIADVTLQAGGVMVVTGKGYGATNIIAMDRDGKVMVDRIVQVEGPTDRLVTVYRGVDRETYSCTPVCQRRVTLGDGATYFSATLSQAGNFGSQATDNATAAAGNSAGSSKN